MIPSALPPAGPDTAAEVYHTHPPKEPGGLDMQEATAEQCDVLVIGGGPAGSTAATVLAGKGWRVVQAEMDVHPRFHIGESLLPANIPLLEKLGVLDKVRALGVLKLGADFPRVDDEPYVFRFSDALGDTPHYAFHVKREDFDAMLFAHARESGADCRERFRIDKVELLPDGVQAQATADNAPAAIRARYLIDASGRETFLGNAMKLKRKNPRHQSAAIFAHFLGVERRPGENEGNISIYRFDQGWAWMIPLPDGVMSVGCVCWPEHLKQRRGKTTQFLLDTLQTIPEAAERMRAATICSETRVTGNYSYQSTAMCGRRWVMVGDAYAFLDPIFSSGVHLAMDSGMRAADMVDTILREPKREAALQRAFQRRVKRGLRTFSWFVYRFNSTAMRQLFAHPSRRWELEQGVISLLAGDVYDSRRVRRKLHLFKGVYAIASLLNLRRLVGDLRYRRRQARVEFTGGNTAQDRH